MVRTNVFPTYIPEIDYKILEDTDDANLLRSCNTNVYLANLCDDEIFWRKRTVARYAMLIKFREPEITWKAFYIRLVNDAMYVVEALTYEIFIYSDIKRAYDELQNIVESLRCIRDTKPVIRLIYKRQVGPYDSNILFDSRHPDTNILQYPNLPALNLKDLNLFYYASIRRKLVTNIGMTLYKNDHPDDKFSGVFDYSTEVLAAFMNYVPYKVNYPHEYYTVYHILTIDSGNNGDEYRKAKYGYCVLCGLLC